MTIMIRLKKPATDNFLAFGVLITPDCESLNLIGLESVSFDEADIICAIKKLKSNFTCGPDGIPPMFYKSLNECLSFPLMTVYQQILSVSYVPDIWKDAIITRSPGTVVVRRCRRLLRSQTDTSC